MQVKRFYLFLLMMAVVFGVSALYVQWNRENAGGAIHKETILLRIRDAMIKAEMADSTEERAQGLSKREYMGADAGMFFVFDEAGLHPFWMKDMKFPLDIIWIGEDFTIQEIEENIMPDTFPRAFAPKIPSRYVLEVHAGFAKANGFMPGDTVLFARSAN